MGKKMVNINGNKPIKEVFKDIMNVMDTLKEEVNNENVDDVKVEPNECTICMNNPSDHIIVPCGHQCGCKQCLVTLKQNGGKCPICRGPINVIQKVYASHTVILQKKKQNVGAPKKKKKRPGPLKKKKKKKKK